MAGNKNSGRKSARDEAKRTKAIEKAWDIVTEILFSTRIDRYSTAKDIVLKDIAQKIEGKGFGTNIDIYALVQRIQQDYKESRSSSVALHSRDGLYEGRTRPNGGEEKVS